MTTTSIPLEILAIDQKYMTTREKKDIANSFYFCYLFFIKTTVEKMLKLKLYYRICNPRFVIGHVVSRQSLTEIMKG